MTRAPLIALAIYLFLLLAAGWRLFNVRWARGAKAATAIALGLPVPLLLILPGLAQPQRPFADILIGLGLTLLACGAACLAAGFATAWIRARKA
jgi:hypothetical protein